MVWEVLNMIGTIAFAISGAIVALEENYDLFGVLVLGLTTAFGGGIIRNLLIGIPTTVLWEQELLLTTALIVIIVVFILPNSWIWKWKRWGVLLDAMGLSAFAIQGALFAKSLQHPLGAVMVAALLTGIGGGIIRDLLAGRKPLVLREEVYALWALLAGLIIDLGWADIENPIHLYLLFGLIVLLRMFSVHFNLKLPCRTLPETDLEERRQL
ncbi:MAG: trimeric intracellular cation channel family protein [Dethiobacteria bacterium]|jgi:uncharacterized membrane protein YeiH|nr:trimeric intracellular cation channel family protein [Bacillota bacterium]